MQRLMTVIAVLLLAAATLVVDAQAASPAGSSRSPAYRVVHGWPALPDGEVLGSVAGVGVDSHRQVFVFHRAGRTWPRSDELDLTPIPLPTIDVFDGHSGKLMNRWGASLFAMPHGLTVDDHDNLWLTDVALQQIYKFSADGQLLLTLGERGVEGNDAGHFNRPTAVAVSPDGSFYVSDGYRNTRIMKFSADGKLLLQWGTKGSGPGQFDLPHGVTLDSSGRVYVADRQNQRIQVFDPAGRYLAEWTGKQLGRPYAITIDHRGMAYVADGGDQPKAPPDRSGWTLLRADGTPLARFGRFGNYDGQFEMAHSIAVDSEGSVYVGDITGARVQKFVRVGAADERSGAN